MHRVISRAIPLCIGAIFVAACAEPAPTGTADLAPSFSHNSGVGTDDKVQCHFRVELTPTEEVPPTTSQASGVAKLMLQDSALKYDVKIDNPANENFLAGHIHLAPRGVNGAVVRGLFPNSPQNDEFRARGFPSDDKLEVKGRGSIAPALASNICANPQNYYVNFHTAQFPGGAIRGQLE
jgi:hypothetical protein